MHSFKHKPQLDSQPLCYKSCFEHISQLNIYISDSPKVAFCSANLAVKRAVQMCGVVAPYCTCWLVIVSVPTISPAPFPPLYLLLYKWCSSTDLTKEETLTGFKFGKL